jgi:uncharacterized protein (TIGR03382 family)
MRMPKYYFAPFIAALVVGCFTYHVKARPFSPCEGGHCPNEDTLEYFYATKAAAQKTQIAQAEAPFWGGGTFAATLVLVVGWQLRRRKA